MFRFFLEIATNPILRRPPSEITTEYNSDLKDINSLLGDICEALQESKRIAFIVEGFGQSPWPVDITTDLAIFLEQLPGLVGWMTDISSTTFVLDFYEQGIDRRLNFDNGKGLVQITCESWGTFEPYPNIEIISREALSTMIKELVQGFLQLANLVAPEIVAHEWFQKWRSEVQ
jgi:hypothetical protein